MLAKVLGSGNFSILPQQQQQQQQAQQQQQPITAACSLQQILTFCRTHVYTGKVWEQIASLIDSATRVVANFRGMEQPPPMQALVASHIGALLRKPVRAR